MKTWYMGSKKPLVLFIFFFFACFCIENTMAQNNFASEEELMKQAKKYFDDEDYVQAYPLYSQLLSLYPQNSDYNFRFGVCMLLTTTDKEKPISYLQKAAQKNGVDNSVYYFLGKAYHLNYRFDEAISNYNTFKRNASRAQAEKYKVDMEIQSCSHGKQLLRNYSELVVIDKKELGEAEFFRSYDLSSIGGKLLVKIDEFKSAVDKKKNEKSVIYLAKNNEVIYYSSYGEDGKNGRDIYYVQKLPGGEWSKAKNLGLPVNTPYDEDYPFLHPNGKVLYFCSKGHNSMGGYDVFKTVYDPVSAHWSAPQNLDFPVSSPDDDILYVTDSLESTAYFSSSRSSPARMTTVYRINTERKPSDIIVIRGKLLKTKEGQKLEAKITVKNAGSGEMLGVYTTDPVTGEYVSNVPNGGKLVFTVEADGFTTQSDLVVMPFQNQMRPVGQEVSFDSSSGKMTIKNQFDGISEESNYLLALNYIRQKAKLEVNFTETPLAVNKIPEKLETPATETPVTPTKSLSNDAIVKIAQDDAKETEQEYKDLKKEADYALLVASEKNEQSLKKSREAKDVLDNAKTIQDPVQKQTETDRGNQLQDEAESLKRNTIASYNVAKQLDNNAKAKKEEADLSRQYANDMEAATKSGNSAEAITRLEEQKQKLENLPKQEKSTDDIYTGLKTDAEMKQRESEQAAARTEELKKEIVNLENESESIKKESEKATNENLKQALLAQSEELVTDIAERKKELDGNQVKEARLKKEAAGMKENSELVGEMMDRMKSGEPSAAEVAAIDRGKLEQQVTQYEETTPGAPVTTTGPPAVTPAPEPAAADRVTIAKIDQEHAEKLSKTETITDIAQKEQAKADVYKEWTEAINKEIKTSRQDFLNETDEAKKVDLVNKISMLEQNEKEKKQLAEASAQKAEQLKQQPVATTPVNTTPAAEAAPSYNETFAQQVQATVSIPNEKNREQAKAAIYKTWNDSLENEIARNKAASESATDPAESQRLNQRIALLDAKRDETKKLENESIARAEQPPVSTETIPVSTTPPTPVTVITDYASPAAAAEESRAAMLKKESSDLKTQSDTYRQQAVAASNETEKKYLLDKADQAGQESQQKQLEAEKNTAAANKQQYNLNTNRLDDLFSRTANKDVTDITVAELLKEEANTHFEQAAKERSDAESVSSFELKEQSLDNANAYEQMALEKQKKATVLYLKHNPGYVYNPGTALARKETLAPENTPLPVRETSPLITESSPPVVVETKTETPSPVNTQPQPLKTEIAPSTTPVTEPVKEARTKEELNTRAADYRQKADEQTKQSQSLLETIDTIQDGKKKIETFEQIKNYDRQAQENYSKSDSLSKAAKTAPAMVREQPVSKATSPVREIQPTTIPSPLPASLASGEVFERKSAPVYSSSNPIPLDAALPEGVIFKVQIGAFRNEIRQDLFQGISPINGERTPQGFIRYTAGVFKKIESAAAARDYVRGEGYPDAFIVAFYNGKRMPVAQARQLLGETVQGRLPVGPNVTPASGSAKETTVTTTPAATTSPESGVGAQSAPVPSGEVAKSERVSSVDGLFYTVQVGVFTRQVSSAELNNIQPLYNDEMENGNIRYYTGIYTDISKASQAKRTVIGLGISDAFVVAYYKGKRVTLADAKLIETTQGGSAFASAPNANQMPTGTASAPRPEPVQPAAIPPVAENNLNPLQPTVPASGSRQDFVLPLTPPQSADDSSVVYKVQIGAFEEYLYMYFREAPFATKATVLDSVRVNEQVPVELANKYFSVKKYGLKSYKDNNGLTIYTVGDLKTFGEAAKLKEQVVAEGIKDAFVVAYSKGKKITLKEARARE